MFMFTRDLVVVQQFVEFLSKLHHLRVIFPVTATSEYQGQFSMLSRHPCPLNVIPFSSTNDGIASFTIRATPATSSILYPFTSVSRSTVRSVYRSAARPVQTRLFTASTHSLNRSQ